MRRLLLLAICLCLICSCNKGGTTPEPGPDKVKAFTTKDIGHEGLSYLWDSSVIPEICFNVPLEEWNKLLSLYDKNNHTKEYIKCDLSFRKGSEVHVIEDAGIRLRGNTSRRRPEGSYGQAHAAGDTDWHHCHFGVNLRKHVKDDEHEIKGIRKFNLKWFKDDACYVREVFCYDLFRRAGVWTAAFDNYCRLWIHVEGDEEPAYFGVYEMIEPYDNKYLDKREKWFGSADGNLWKCSYPAFLDKVDDDFGEDDNIHEYSYELKESGGGFEDAKAQLQDFIYKLNKLSDADFRRWIKQVCDVELLLRTYAVNVAVGMWDDMWNNGNNYYLYFNSLDKENYKVFLLPYDYDNTLGTSNCYDAALQDPYDWGEKGVLIERLLQQEEFRNIYRDELKRLIDPELRLMDHRAATLRISNWQNQIREYISNDTGEDMRIEDKPASWGNIGDYRLMSEERNYFKAKAATIERMQ